jgi:hypothetical protein
VSDRRILACHSEEPQATKDLGICFILPSKAEMLRYAQHDNFAFFSNLLHLAHHLTGPGVAVIAGALQLARKSLHQQLSSG